MKDLNEDIQRCIDECLNCHKICLETASYCLDNCEDDHIKHLLRCAEVSNSCASSILLKADNIEEICQLCEYACKVCADAFGNINDEQMQKCADSCRKCSDACSKLNMEMKC